MRWFWYKEEEELPPAEPWVVEITLTIPRGKIFRYKKFTEYTPYSRLSPRVQALSFASGVKSGGYEEKLEDGRHIFYPVGRVYEVEAKASTTP